MEQHNEALVVIDMQRGFDNPRWGERNHPQAEAQGLRLLAHWRHLGLPVILVRHDSTTPGSTLRPGQPGHAFKPGFELQDADWLVTKEVNSAFIGTGLEARLRSHGIRHLTVFGLTTDHCVSTTVRMAANLGFKVRLVEDACACFGKTRLDGQPISADALHQAHIASLMHEFATVVSTQAVISGAPAHALSP